MGSLMFSAFYSVRVDYYVLDCVLFACACARACMYAYICVYIPYSVY